jgi:hypothetical protein
VSHHVLDGGMPPLVDDIELVVSELAPNAMAHGQTPCTVVLCAFDKTVALEVSDGSPLEASVVVPRSQDTSGRW